ncbi:FecCD family ABC transporter permease [Streptococcus pseudoporcinus]|uniref:Iron chelate uptake ABC transporter, FeCT family, permease protein n=1 Tax=Streptococcus pseudoporcinus LQ 940-04 TaxID=875093 RepID=G5K8Q1_9STRE|nr:iron ABC transporter permease [Streptococcus pseudoporcinus]EFR43847.1 iron chelate uptake ABC transporter, FeCT family, permease protein [Streptococcus pseudoporcinus SPIN 20026]EHI64072.1 iron chelate uptake ABC transporter, FeCT family, permease protein [Streptococcus pseudoporcinus LQ 940-04]VEF94348.1 iron chelate uptake ABC transporter, FeCT family, permease protein [Streptococcus pseudoporcinus]
MTDHKKLQLILLLAFLLITLSVLALTIGDSSFSLKAIGHLIFGKADSTTVFILTKIRLPRLLAALFGGASLALSGNILQTLTKNPLADSGILGINAGAGIVIAIFTAFGFLETPASLYSLPFFAMIGSGLSVALVYRMSHIKNRPLNPVTLIITGVGLSMMLSSLMIALVGNVNHYKTDYIVTWLSGNITGDDWPTLTVIMPLLIILWLSSYWQAYQLNLMTLSDDMSVTLGFQLKKERLLSLILSSSLAALSVVLVGNIAFVGLMAGHLSRRLAGEDHRFNLPTSLLLGMLLMLVADTITRVFLVGSNIPTGILVSIIGAPYFLYLMMQTRN